MSCDFSLSRPRRRRLVRIMKATRETGVLVRCQILLRVAEGASARAAALQVGCVPSTGWTIVTRFRREGESSLIDRRVENGSRKVDPDIEEGIRQILRYTPAHFGHRRPTWTLEILAAVIASNLRVVLSVGHLWKVLRRMRVRWGRPRPVVFCPWKPRARRRRLAELKSLFQNPRPGEVVLFEDEVDLHLNPRIGPDWMLPGTQRLVITPGRNQKRYLAGAFDPRGGHFVYVEGERKVSGLFLRLLAALLDRFRTLGRIHLILDNYIIHKSRIVQRWLEVHGRRIRLHFLPPYTPEANLIERVWKDLHDNVTRNHRCPTIRVLMQEVRLWLHDRFGIWSAYPVTS